MKTKDQEKKSKKGNVLVGQDPEETHRAVWRGDAYKLGGSFFKVKAPVEGSCSDNDVRPFIWHPCLVERPVRQRDTRVGDLLREDGTHALIGIGAPHFGDCGGPFGVRKQSAGKDA